MNILNRISLKFVLIISCVIFLSACDYEKQTQVAPDPDVKKQQQLAPDWQKVGENLYFDINSLEKDDSIAGGNFKEYFISKKDENYKNAYYQIISTAAYCNIEQQGGIKKLEYPIYKYYDKNDKLIGETNIHEYWRKQYPDGHLGITHPEDEVNGDIYFETLCKKY